MNKNALPRFIFLTCLSLLFLAIASQMTFLPTNVLAQAATPIPTVTSNTIISVVPASLNVQPGDSFDIGIQINSDIPTWGLQFAVSYDPNLLEITGAQESSFYKDWAAQNGASSMIMPNPVPDNSKGFIPTFAVIVAGAKAGEGPQGKGELFILKAKAKTAGSVEIKLSDLQVSDAGANAGNTTEVGGVKIQNAIVAIGSDVVPQQPAILLNTGLAEPTPENSAVQAEPTVERKVPTKTDSSSAGIPWEIYLPLGGVFVLGLIIFGLTRKPQKSKSVKK
jgi:hypothetical protein